MTDRSRDLAAAVAEAAARQQPLYISSGDSKRDLLGRDCDVKLRTSAKPEFDAWRWLEYWVPLDHVIEFKREVYRQALAELHRFLGADRRRRARPAAAGRP